MSKQYYVAKEQSNGEYLYATKIEYNTVEFKTTYITAIAMNTKQQAENLKEICALIDNDEHVVVSIEVDVREED